MVEHLVGVVSEREDFVEEHPIGPDVGGVGVEGMFQRFWSHPSDRDIPWVVVGSGVGLFMWCVSL